jgi:D-aminoacyl-tRNA deacylase
MLVRSYLVERRGFEPVGLGTLEELRGPGVSAYVSEKHHLHLSGDELSSLGADLIIVASAHRSEGGEKSLTTHATGNWTSEAPMGGEPLVLSYTMAGAIRAAFDALLEETGSNSRLDGWRVGLEVTHHGPYSPIPLIYVEFGGPPEARMDPAGAEAVAEACIRAAGSSPSPRAAVGIGGGHYAPTFTRLMLEKEYDFGHMMPKYVLPEGIGLLGQALERVIDSPKVAVIDWKGVPGAYRQRIASLLAELGCEAVKR